MLKLLLDFELSLREGLSGYRVKLIQKDVIDGVAVTRLPLYPSHDQGVLGRIFNYGSFAVSSLLYGVFFSKKADLIYAYHPPLTVGVAAVLLRFLRRIPVVYDIQDMWPDTLRATGMFSNERALILVSRVCDWVYKHVDYIIVLSPGFRRLLIERGVPSAKIDVIYNWCAEDAISERGCDDLPAGFPAVGFRVLFAGNIGKARALPAVFGLRHSVARGAICSIRVSRWVSKLTTERNGRRQGIGERELSASRYDARSWSVSWCS